MALLAVMFRIGRTDVRWRSCARPRRQVVGVSRILGVLALTVGVALAAEKVHSPQVGQFAFDIPAQPLVDALQSFSRQSGIQVMFETASAAGYTSFAVEGEFTPDAALRLLLTGTDLKIRYSRSSAVTLAPASAPDPDAPPMRPLASADIALDTLHVGGGGEAVDGKRLGEYIGTVQADIQKALNDAARNRRGEYRATVKLWVSPSSRIVDKVELHGSTGDRDRDSTIVEVLRGMTLSQQAPPNTPRPIRFMISVHAL